MTCADIMTKKADQLCQQNGDLLLDLSAVKAENKSLKKTVLDLQEEVMDLQNGIIESDGE